MCNALAHLMSTLSSDTIPCISLSTFSKQLRPINRPSHHGSPLHTIIHKDAHDSLVTVRIRMFHENPKLEYTPVRLMFLGEDLSSPVIRTGRPSWVIVDNGKYTVSISFKDIHIPKWILSTLTGDFPAKRKERFFLSSWLTTEHGDYIATAMGR